MPYAPISLPWRMEASERARHGPATGRATWKVTSARQYAILERERIQSLTASCGELFFGPVDQEKTGTQWNASLPQILGGPRQLSPAAIQTRAAFGILNHPFPED